MGVTHIGRLVLIAALAITAGLIPTAQANICPLAVSVAGRPSTLKRSVRAGSVVTL